jgi:hypothetical protein
LRIGGPLDGDKLNTPAGQFVSELFGSLLRRFAHEGVPVAAANIRSDLLADALIHARNPFVGKALQAHC